MSRRGRRTRADRGQSSVEFALVLPLVVLVLMVVVQAGLVVRDQILVVHAAREAVRAAAVGDSDTQVRAAASQAGPLSVDRLTVAVDRAGSADPADGTSAPVVRVQVRYRSATDIPMVGELIPDIDLTAVAVMDLER